MVVITAFYAGLTGLFYLGLSLNVIRNRFRYKQSLGAGKEQRMERAIRIHGNFSEYVPLILIMMSLLELNKESETLLHIIGVTLITGRLLHAYGLGVVQGPSQGRLIGTVCTFACLIGGSIKLIVSALEKGF